MCKEYIPQSASVLLCLPVLYCSFVCLSVNFAKSARKYTHTHGGFMCDFSAANVLRTLYGWVLKFFFFFLLNDFWHEIPFCFGQQQVALKVNVDDAVEMILWIEIEIGEWACVCARALKSVFAVRNIHSLVQTLGACVQVKRMSEQHIGV